MVYAFESFTLDADRHELRSGDQLVAIEPLVFDLLLYLIRNRDRVVSKDDLISAVWKRRIVSESTLNSSINAVRQSVGDNGENQRIIRTIPRKGFRFVGAVRKIEKDQTASASDRLQVNAEAGSARLQLPEKPSIAILPFANLSGDPEQEYFADGVTEDLITALSQFRWLFVIAHGSSSIYKQRTVDLKQVGRELGVRYVVEGSVRKAENRLRITAQLTDAANSGNLWASRFDGELRDIFELQDQVTADIVGAIAPKLEQAEIERAKRKPTENLDAYDLYLRGVACTAPYTQSGYAEAFALFQRAIQLDPEFAAAYGMAAWCCVTQKVNAWAITEAKIAEGIRMAREAVQLANQDAVAYCWGGFSLDFLAEELDDAIVYVDRALVLNPNLAAGWFLGGHLNVYAGDLEGGIGRLNRAIRLSPLDPLIFRGVNAGLAYAHFLASRNDEALACVEKALRERPNWLTAIRIGAACHAVAGQLEQARKLMARMRELDPALRISNLHGLPPLGRADDFAKWTDALRKAGLPE
ncbi:MAG: winged helix-turn-helix domain-containing tetratricopeptide repeat protein [Pseudorhodoplanes sp.]